MPVIEWDKVGNRVYETGLDRGVLYLPDGSAVPWNGLTSIIEKFDKESSPVYYDGMKINDLVSLGDFSASMNAITYPDEFMEFEGLNSSSRAGVYYADQPGKSFGLCYRTQIGTDYEGDNDGYRIHILYNVTAIPSDKTYATTSVDPSLVEFEWTITAVPEEAPGLRPTAHIIIDTRKVDPALLAEIEFVLYGSQFASASLIPMPDLITMMNTFFRFEIIDHGDGTWSAVADDTDFSAFVVLGAANYFEISNINASYLDDQTYIVSSTVGPNDVPQIRIYDAGGGIWTATSDFAELIVTVSAGEVNILNATTVVIDADSYQISDTPA